MFLPKLIDEDIVRWLKEDIPYWDVTTVLLPETKKESKARIIAKQEGIIAGLPIVKRIFEFAGVNFVAKIKEGDKVSKKTVIATVIGDIKSLLQIERIALNVLGRLSGIATTTDKMVALARKHNPNIKICATRKVIPGFAKYDKYAITIGGGDTHRFNLSDMVLIKENHLRFFDSVSEAIQIAKEKTSFSKKIEIEVQNEEQALEATKSAADIVMLDNFPPVQAKIVAKKIKEINKNILVELSGNITLENIESFPLQYVDLISSGSLTHSVRNFDLTMLIE